MEATTLLWIFLGVWGGLLLLYVIYKLCGGRIVDCFSCECFSGPCCDCWGNGGQISAYDREFPFARGVIAPGGGGGAQGARSASLPPIVIVNSLDDDDESSSSDEEDAEGKSRSDSRRRSQYRSISGRGRGIDEYDEEYEAGPMLLRSSQIRDDGLDPVVVV